MLEIINRLDLNILDFIQSNLRNYFLDKLMIIITSLGNGGCFWIALMVVLLFTEKYRNVGILAIIALILSTIMGEVIIKNIVQRPRPFLAVTTINMLIAKPLTYSFPSGHATVAFAVAGVLFEKFKKYGFIFIMLALLISFSRIYLFVHYPSDVIAGIALGLVCSKIVLYVSGKSKYRN